MTSSRFMSIPDVLFIIIFLFYLWLLVQPCAYYFEHVLYLPQVNVVLSFLGCNITRLLLLLRPVGVWTKLLVCCCSVASCSSCSGSPVFFASVLFTGNRDFRCSLLGSWMLQCRLMVVECKVWRSRLCVVGHSI